MYLSSCSLSDGMIGGGVPPVIDSCAFGCCHHTEGVPEVCLHDWLVSAPSIIYPQFMMYPENFLKPVCLGFVLSFSSVFFSWAGSLGEWVGRCGVQHGQWMIGGSPLIIHPRQMDNTKIAQNWRTNILAFSFLVGAKINQQWRRRKNLICSTQFETCL